MSLKDDIRNMRMDPPGGYGAFDDQDHEPEECPECDGLGNFPDTSACCGANRDIDTGFCYECKDHSDPSECDICNGIGMINL